jgi:hypothetical protein
VTAAPRPRRHRTLLWGIVLVLLLAIAALWQPITAFARTGAAYGARIACSCRFVAGRPLGQCRDDFEPGMALIMLSEDATARSVTATFPLLAHQTATWRAGEGCRLEPWR